MLGVPGHFKSWYRTRNPKLAPVAEALNKIGAWLTGLKATVPLALRDNGLSKEITWEPRESPYPHPWRVSWNEDGTVDVQGGIVYDGTNALAVTGLTGLTLGTGDKIWLRVHYHNDPADPDVAELVSGAAWPADDYEADVLPDASPLTLPKAGWSTTYLRVAEIDANGVLWQYLWEDQLVPKGGTYTVTTCIGFRLSGVTLQRIMLTQTTVNGVPRIVTSAPVAVDIADLSNCPTT